MIAEMITYKIIDNKRTPYINKSTRTYALYSRYISLNFLNIVKVYFLLP